MITHIIIGVRVYVGVFVNCRFIESCLMPNEQCRNIYAQTFRNKECYMLIRQSQHCTLTTLETRRVRGDHHTEEVRIVTSVFFKDVLRLRMTYLGRPVL